MPEFISPAFILLSGALLIGVTRGPWRSAAVLITPLLALWAAWQVPDGIAVHVSFMGQMLEPVEGSPLRRLFATIFTLMAFGGGLYAFRQASWYELAAAYAYAAGAVGVCFAGDLITFFVYWEMMAIFSTVVVWCGGTPGARAAGIRYAIMHLLGGVILMVGIIGIAINSNSIDIKPMLATNLYSQLVLIGILINAAAPPVSAWLADAYPESNPTGSVFLSAFTTKTAVLALILLFPGESILVGVGLYMVVYGIIYALLENDVRRILAYSIINQVGFMVCAVGIGTEMALNGAAAHAFAHIIYKALLFMSAGAVIYRTGVNNCTDLGGLFRTMPLTAACGIVGALAISGFPLTSGFVTKTMVSQAAIDEGLITTYFLLAAASAGVFLHAGIKFPWFVFFQRDSGLRPKDAPWNMAAAMLLFSALCILIGIFPQTLYQFLPYPVEYQAYTASKVIYYLQLLLFSGLAFFLLLPLMRRTRTISLDTDWVWRVLLFRTLNALGRLIESQGTQLEARVRTRMTLLRGWAQRNFSSPMSDKSVPRGIFAQDWSIGASALWIASLLAGYVLFYFV